MGGGTGELMQTRKYLEKIEKNGPGKWGLADSPGPLCQVLPYQGVPKKSPKKSPARARGRSPFPEALLEIGPVGLGGAVEVHIVLAPCGVHVRQVCPPTLRAVMEAKARIPLITRLTPHSIYQRVRNTRPKSGLKAARITGHHCDSKALRHHSNSAQ